MIEPKVFVHKQSWVMATQIPIYLIREWREATKEEKDWYNDNQKKLQIFAQNEVKMAIADGYPID